MRLHESLWEENLDLARACLAHPFVRGLAEGTLRPALFQDYIAQDAFFLRAFARAYALALARSEDMVAARVFHRLIGGTFEELQTHGRYAAELGIDLDRVVPNRACRAYTDFLLRTAWQGSPGEIVSAMTPCMRLYAYLGWELAPLSHPGHPYRRWIETYRSDDFAALAGEIEALLDRLGTDSQTVRDRYRYAMQCELDFFSEFGA